MAKALISWETMRRGVKERAAFTRAFVFRYVKKPPPPPSNSTFHHHWSVPSINGQVCPQSIPICLLCFSRRPSPSLRIPLFHFSHYPLVSPLLPLKPSCLTPWGLRGRLSLRWFINSSLRRNQYFINKPRGAFALILYDLSGKGLPASISSSSLLPKLCC